ncbi:hypothetical protein D3C87_1404220 [compost metagenome]
MFEQRRKRHRQHADTDRDRDDDAVAGAVELHARQFLNACHRGHAEHHDRAATQHRRGHRRDQCTQFGEQPHQHHDCPGSGHNESALDVGECYQTGVLSEGVIGETVEQTTEHGRQAISAERIAEGFLGGRLAGQFADGQAIASGLGHDHQHCQGHDQNRHQRKFRRTERQRRTQFKPRRFAHSTEMGHATGCGNQATDEQTDEYAEVADEAFEFGVDH